MHRPQVAASIWRQLVARVSPEAAALALAAVVLILAWLLRPAASVERGSPEPSSRPGSTSESIQIGRWPQIPVSLALSWPRRT